MSKKRNMFELVLLSIITVSSLLMKEYVVAMLATMTVKLISIEEEIKNKKIRRDCYEENTKI